MDMIEIICTNTGIRKEYPLGTSLQEIAEDQKIKLKDDILGAKVNNKLRELSYRIFKPKTVEFIDIEDPIGYAMYMRSMVFILFKAVRDLWPETTLKVEHSLPIGSYCEIMGWKGDITNQMVIDLRKRMAEIVEADLPIGRKQVPTAEAIEIFKQQHLNEKVLLFQCRDNVSGKCGFRKSAYLLLLCPVLFFLLLSSPKPMTNCFCPVLHCLFLRGTALLI